MPLCTEGKQLFQVITVPGYWEASKHGAIDKSVSLKTDVEQGFSSAVSVVYPLTLYSLPTFDFIFFFPPNVQRCTLLCEALVGKSFVLPEKILFIPL